MKIIDIVKFNDRHAFVLDRDYSLTYEKHGDLLIGSDKSQTFFDVLQNRGCGGNPNFGGNYAFGGRKFDIPMKDGSVTHCYGQYWDSGYADAEKILGIKFADFTHATIDFLRMHFVFQSGTIDRAKLQPMLDEFQRILSDYEPREYNEYATFVKNAEEPREPCNRCIKAEWTDMYGTLVYGCDMSHCIMGDEDVCDL